MSTRSSARNLFPPLDNPELTIRRRSPADPTLLNDFEMAAEGNGDDDAKKDDKHLMMMRRRMIMMMMMRRRMISINQNSRDGMKPDLQAQVADLELRDVIMAKFKKSSALVGYCRIDSFCKRVHDNHLGDDAPPEGKKNLKKQKMSKSTKSTRGSSSKQQVKETNTSASEQQQQDWDAWVDTLVIDNDELIPKGDTQELINEFHIIDKRVPTIFYREIVEVIIKDILSNQFRDVGEYAYHLKQAQN
nr:hypothetical protein [Tanacetum cinerariifolium]